MIYTFYSFKGGVGRSMALANVAELFARQGMRVLMVDMDLEAPGLERFFEEGEYLHTPDEAQKHRGVMDLLASYKELKRLPAIEGEGTEQSGQPRFPVEPLRGFVVPLKESGRGALMLLPAGRRDRETYASYAAQVRAFDWDDFYLRWDGEAFFDWFREEALTLADVVLIDSRTGITELSGICAFHLADAVVMFVAPNRQNIDGCALVAESLQDPVLIDQGRGGRELKILAVPSRVDNSESGQLDQFAKDFAMRLEGYAPSDLQFDNSAFIDLKIPYVPTYAYREAIAVAEAERAVATELIAAYGRLVSTMVELAPASSRVQRLFQRSPTIEIATGSGPAVDIVGRPWAAERVSSWLRDGESSVLMITGEPGSGKTMLLRWLAGLYSAPRAARPELPGTLLHVHYCSPFEDADARPFVEMLARRLGKLLPQYASSVRYQRNPNISVDVRSNISATSDSGTFVDDVVLGTVPSVTAFEELVCRPLPDENPSDPLVVFVDGLDAAGRTTTDSLVSLLGVIASGRLGSRLRFLITTRGEASVLRAVSTPRFDLIADEPHGAEDLREYVTRRAEQVLGDASEPERDAFVKAIFDASEGNFLYAATAVPALASGELEASGRSLPASLASTYRDEITRRIATDPATWSSDQRVLGVLGVARAPLTSNELAVIVGWPLSKVDEVLERWAPFLVYRPDDHGIALYHQSFREFLLTDATFRVYPDEAHQAIVRFLLEDAAVGWLPSARLYGVEQMLPHIIGGMVSARNRSDRLWLAETAGQLLANPEFLYAAVSRGGWEGMVAAIVQGASELASLSRIPGVEVGIKAALPSVRETLLARLAASSDPLSAIGDLLAMFSWNVTTVYADAYEGIRLAMPAGGERTELMNVLVSELRHLAERGVFQGIGAKMLFDGSDGERLVALAILKAQPDPGQFNAICAVLADSHSAFEQFHALDVVGRLLPLLSSSERADLLRILDDERRDVRGLGVMDDPSRRNRILGLISKLLDEEPQLA